MNPFAIAPTRSFREAAGLLADKRFSLPMLKAGGMDLLDHMKEGLISPDVLISIRKLRTERGAAPIGDAAPGSARPIRIEATATLAEIASSDLLLKRAPVVAMAAANAATPQVRNVATAAGNLLQRPRCWYYRHAQFDCLKKGGSTCFAVEGENRYHAILGGGPCHIVHPSNLAPALMVCSAVVHVIGSDRSEIPMAGLYHAPEKGVKDEHNLKPGEVVTHITLEAAPASGFYAIKEKQSFDWPVAAAAVTLVLDGAKIKSARVCGAAAAPLPWALPKVEAALAGVSVDDDAALRKACAISVEGAKPLSENGYKLKLLPVAVRRAVLIAAGRKTGAETEESNS